MKDIKFSVKSNLAIADNIFRMELKTSAKLPQIMCGQFLNLEVVGHDDLILRRPFCICDFGADWVSVVYAVLGKGTTALSKLKTGTNINALLPLGNGFVLDKKYTKIAIIGGGLGVAPLLSISKCYLDKEYKKYLGFASKKSVILEKEFGIATTITTDDGSYGIKGYPTTALENDIIGGYKPDIILTCGSHNMMGAVAKLATKYNIPALASTEERMACGIGACLVCVCKVNGRYARVCADGPVFDIRGLAL
ncbi:MAG: dihydroorotate dehydrogenase electron transfer subunit [Firmicutes bacterium]|nr:dihydroorotate dehydrogenase electron transfer subunit [Bacillota bacterium]